MNICATVALPTKSEEIYTTYVCITNSEMSELKRIINLEMTDGKVVSCIEIDEIPWAEEHLVLEDFKLWLSKLKFHKKVPFLVDTKTRIIELPKEIMYCQGRLIINIGKSFDNMQHDDCANELQHAEWILRTFPHSRYSKSRISFDLAEPGKKYSGEINVFASYRHEYNEATHRIVEFKCLYKERNVLV